MLGTIVRGKVRRRIIEVACLERDQYFLKYVEAYKSNHYIIVPASKGTVLVKLVVVEMLVEVRGDPTRASWRVLGYDIPEEHGGGPKEGPYR